MRTLYLLVFSAGLVTLGMELSAARLLEPAFGNSQLVWAALIGLILCALAVGAWLGGALADRYPRRRELEWTLTAAGLSVALAPLLSVPVLQLAAVGMAELAPGLLASALAAVTLLFALPAVLLGTATPWAVRLAVTDLRQTGQIAGRFSAVATAGSLLGAFLPVLWLIPTFGTRWTFYLLSLYMLAVVSGCALRQPYRWVPLGAFALVLGLALFAQPAGVRAAWDDRRTGAILFEQESAFNYIAVREWGSERHLKLNDGVGIHSVYHPEMLLSQGIWDYFLLAPMFRVGEERQTQSREGTKELGGGADAEGTRDVEKIEKWRPQNLVLVGAAAGTVPGLYTQIYGSVPITGIELDPAVLAVGKNYFAASWPNYTPVAADGRRWLAQQPADVKFDVIALDAYRPPYIPFHLTTREFFALVRSHLEDDGVVAINVGRTNNNFTLVDAMAATLLAVFPTVFVVDEPGPPGALANSLVVATMQPTDLGALRHNAATLGADAPVEWREFVQKAATEARLAQPPAASPIFTDDRSQVEQVVHGVIFDYLTQ